jgi:hypothetical protein
VAVKILPDSFAADLGGLDALFSVKPKFSPPHRRFHQ